MTTIGFARRRLPLVLAATALLGSASASAYQFQDQNPVKQPKESFGDRQAGKFGTADSDKGKFGTEGADGQFRDSKVVPVRRADAVPVLDAHPMSTSKVSSATRTTTATTVSRRDRH